MKKCKALYLALILIIWLVTYITSSALDSRKIELDEIKYLACAKGISENLDFSSRATTTLGLIKYGFPHHAQHLPLHSFYIALFFKLFGASLDVAYFATWFSALITCLGIYLSLLLVTNNSSLFSFFLAVSFLYLPRLEVYCNSVFMEVPGCALLSVLIFLLFKGISKGKVSSLLLALASLFLYLYKGLFIGIIFGFISVIVFSTIHIGFESGGKLKFLSEFIKYIGTMVVAWFVFAKFIFLPLVPWFNVLPKDEVAYGTYADFAGGFFSNIPDNLKENLMLFINKVIIHYYPFLINLFYKEKVTFYPIFINYWFELGIYLLVFFYMTVFSFFLWKRLTTIQKAFILFTIVSIASFNIIYLTVVGCTGIGLFYRYNIIYFPLLIVSVGIISWVTFQEFIQSFFKSKIKVYFLLLSFIVLVYIPIYFSSYLVINPDPDWRHDTASINSKIIGKFIHDTKPMFIYIRGGSFAIWEFFPLREVFMEATNEQIKKINSILPQPIEYLFLTPDNVLFKENQTLIIKAQPIIDNLYNFYGVDFDNKTVVYKLNSSKV